MKDLKKATLNNNIIKKIPEFIPKNPCFSSGPCAKRPNWDLNALQNFNPGRSHRHKSQKAKLLEIINKTKKLLNIPQDYLVAITPASDTGAMEMCLWNLLGQRGVDVFSWEAFSKDWQIDCCKELKLLDLNIYHSEFGFISKLELADKDRDIVFPYNGTTSGVCVPNLDFISDKREGLSICDATSAVFSYEIDWSKLDATTFSWQKVMGSEAGLGMIVLSPKAIVRLETFRTNRALPKIFRLTKNGKLISGIFEGATINTPSMLAVEDALDSLKWIESIGGLKETINRTENNFNVIKDWVNSTDIAEFLAVNEETISKTSICLKITYPKYLKLSNQQQQNTLKQILQDLENGNIAYDIESYRDAPLGIRIWAGATVESNDLRILMNWLDYKFYSYFNKE